jgi:hypothetical protein
VSFILISICLTALGVQSGEGLDAQPVPERVPRPYLAVEPWAGFWPLPGGYDSRFPLDATAQFLRWENLRRPVLAEGVGDRSGPEPPEFLRRESDDFRTMWPAALAAGRDSRADECRRHLESVPAQTLEGERAARQLLFAAAILQNDRPIADSLYYRMTWRDGGRTVSRLDAWRELESGRGSRALHALSAIYNPTSGEMAARAMANWQAHPTDPGPAVPAWSQAGGLARQSLSLADARWTLMNQDRDKARTVLDNVQPEFVPAEWAETYARLNQAVGASQSGQSPDLADYQELANTFLSGRDADAMTQANVWLSTWPESPLRAHTYFIRAHLHAAAGHPEEGESDLRAAEGNPMTDELRSRIALLRAFLMGQLGRGAEANRSLNQLIRGPLGEVAEPELRFDQSRLGRLLEDEASAQALTMQLEEAFMDTPWPARARADTAKASWREPWRVIPVTPEVTTRVEAPRAGPWGELLWGETFLAREAEILTAEMAPDEFDAAMAEAEPVSTPVVEPAAAPSSNTPMAFLDVGIGAPAALVLGGGLAGLVQDVHYRADAAQTYSEGRNELPDYRRTDWEAGVGGSPGEWRLGLVAEGPARTDDGAAAIGLNPEPVEASWWGIRGDVTYKEPEDEGISASVAAIDGKVDAGPGKRWDSKQQWYAVSGAGRPGGPRWEGALVLAHFDNQQPGVTDFRRWYHNLRVARSLTGGWYVGAVAALYLDRALLMPVAGIEREFGEGWTAWAATEPSLQVPSFREVFVADGDWNVPDLTLAAERRYLDLRGGVRWRDEDRHSLAVGGEAFRTGQFRSWEQTGGLWTERALTEDATGFRLVLSGASRSGGFRATGKVQAQSVRANSMQVPYVPRYEGWLELSYAYQGWRAGAALKGVAGRTDEFEQEFGDFLRLDIDAAYRFRTHSLPLGFRNLEFSVGIENLADVADQRWPGVPPYGFGIIAGFRALYGSQGGR